jgi:hypothetical protein
MSSAADGWLYVEAKKKGRDYMAGVRFPLEQTLRPDFDHHVAVTVDYAAHWRTGLPKPKDLPRLRDLEDSFLRNLESHGVFVGSESTDGRRTMHLFVRGEGPLVEMWRAHEAAGKQGGIAVTVRRDPHWDGIAHLRAFEDAA